MNANTERIKWGHMMTKNYLDTNPAKSWLDLFTTKQVNWSQGLGSSSLQSLLKYGVMETNSVCVQKPCRCRQQPSFSPFDLFLSLCVTPFMYAFAQLLWRWLMLSLEAERSDHAVTSSCFCLCHRGTVSFLLMWGLFRSGIHRCCSPSRGWQQILTYGARKHVVNRKTVEKDRVRMWLSPQSFQIRKERCYGVWVCVSTPTPTKQMYALLHTSIRKSDFLSYWGGQVWGLRAYRLYVQAVNATLLCLRLEHLLEGSFWWS